MSLSESVCEGLSKSLSECKLAGSCFIAWKLMWVIQIQIPPLSLSLSPSLSIYIYLYMHLYLPTPPPEQETTQGQFLMRSLTGLNTEFSSTQTGCHTDAKESSLLYHFSHSWRGNYFPKVLALCEMPIDLTMIYIYIYIYIVEKPENR